jgi:4-amino-4-deoxy-L-arabinose transferase-like glycosyltransferase
VPGAERTHLTLILVAWIFTMALGLGDTALWEPDEPRFAEATRQMFERRDFITPWFNDRPRFEKPVLMYWMQAPFVAVLGPTEAAFRMPSALCGLLTLFLMYRMGGRLVSPRAGLVAALALATTFRFVLYARQGLTDVPVTMFVTASIRAFQEAFLDSGQASLRWALVGWAATGAAALTKGPVAVIGPLVWAIVVGLRDWRAGWKRWHVFGGVLVAAAIVLPWYAVMIARYGRTFLDLALGYEVVARYLSPDFPGRDRGFFYFFGVWLGDGAPWSLFFLGGVIWALRSWRSLDSDVRHAVTLSVVWCLTVLLLFSASQYKLPHYIVPAYPPTALLVGGFADALVRGRVEHPVVWRAPAVLAGLLLLLGAVLLTLLLRHAFGLSWVDPAFVLPLLLASGALAIVVATCTARDWQGLAVLLATLLLAYGYIATIVAPRELRRFQPIPTLASAVRAIAPDREPLAVAGNYGAPGLVFYARRPVRQLADRDDLVRYLSGPGPRMCVLPATDFEAVRPKLDRPYVVVAQGSVFSVRMRRLLERAPERAERRLILISTVAPAQHQPAAGGGRR